MAINIKKISESYDPNKVEWRNYKDPSCKEFKIEVDDNILKSEALEWSITRGARSGRVAWQFIQDLASKKQIKID